jgi:hypothetical protein
MSDRQPDFEFDRVARSWLDDGPTQLSDRVLADALAEVHRTPQRRGRLALPGRWHTMSTFLRAGVAAAFLLAMGTVGVALLGSPSTVTTAPTPSPVLSPTPALGTALPSTAPSASPAPSPTPTPEALRPFHWERHGFTVDIPVSWEEAGPLEMPGEVYPSGTEWGLRFWAPVTRYPWMIVSVAPLGDRTVDEWRAANRELHADCPEDEAGALTVDGLDATYGIGLCDNGYQQVHGALIHDESGNRLIEIAVIGAAAGKDVQRELFDRIVASFRLDDA